MKEIWKDIPGYVGYYQVSNKGRVRGLDRVVFNPNRWKKKNGTMKVASRIKSQCRDKYKQAILSKNSKLRGFTIHRLVAKAFILNLHNKPCINHKDGNPKNNNVENLEWCTYSENTKHAYKTGLMPSDLNAGSKNGKSKLTTEEVLTIREIFSQIDKGKNYIRDIYKDLGEVFDIGFRELSRIIKRTHWKIEINEPNQIIDYRTQRCQKEEESLRAWTLTLKLI